MAELFCGIKPILPYESDFRMQQQIIALCGLTQKDQ